MQAGIAVLERIRAQGHAFEGMTFLEVGTGRRLALPTALWLGGASRVVTVDANAYLKEALVIEDLRYIKDHRGEVEALFTGFSQHPLFLERFDLLMRAEHRLSSLIDLMRIEYIAPADAACLDLISNSVQYHVSYTVFEHISPSILNDILVEAQRIMKPGGLLIHYIDFSDHFSHSDPSISSVNFLQFSDTDWEKYAGHRYTHHNRLRLDDMICLFEASGVELRAVASTIDDAALSQLRRGFPLDARFRGKRDETNATINAWIVASSRTDLVEH
jgi:hypothetical protein